jgi:putative holliday junction resolvase
MAKKLSLLGIDYGEANIGLAFGRDGVATPLRVVSGKNSHSAINDIARVVEEYDVDKIIMGLPLSVDGKETAESLVVRKFTKLLKAKIKLPLEFVDEYYTTKATSGIMLNSGVSQKNRRTKDHYSASLILRRYYKQD